VARHRSCSFFSRRKGGGPLDAPGRGLLGAKGEYPLRASYLLGVSSHAAPQWFLSFQVPTGGAWLRSIDAWATANSGAAFARTGGGWGRVDFAPGTSARVECSSPALATTSVAIIETTR
jgi:hypothetical protein